MLKDPQWRDSTTACDVEPIHIPGSIQPHGSLILAEAATGNIVGWAGDTKAFFGQGVKGGKLASLIPNDAVTKAMAAKPGGLTILGRIDLEHRSANAVAYRTGDLIAVELDQAETTPSDVSSFLSNLDATSVGFERAASIGETCAAAAASFRELTGYDRVMIYQFLDDDSGVVIGESKSDDVPTFMNHHFPASDIPKQARALYVRNRARVISDVDYEPTPIYLEGDRGDIDLSDSTLRSVSPIHIQYLKNMGLKASASFSLVRDGVLWGLVACHHTQPRQIPLPVRMGCTALANALSRQLRMKEETALYRERLRLRSQEDAILNLLGGDRSLDDFFRKSGEEIAHLLAADGFAAVQGRELFTFGKCPDNIDIREIADNIRIPAARQPLVTSSLSRQIKKAAEYQDRASGLLAVTMSTEVPTILMWFRAEHVETLQWAGNPHKDIPLEEGATLTPRASFEAWTEIVRGKARPWSHAEQEAATRIVRLMLDFRANNRMRELNRELTSSLRENEQLVGQKDFLLKEVNHRVQNSLQLVSAFLRLQAREAISLEVKASLDEAQKRLNAVALVHRRLYQDDSVEIVDLARYIETLLSDMTSTMDKAWSDQMVSDLTPVLIATDKAVNLGLVLTELVINVQKYAYGGSPGPVSVRLEQHRGSLRLIVADRGQGKDTLSKGGFGSRMLSAIIERLHGHLDEEDNSPGLRVTVTCPIQDVA